MDKAVSYWPDILPPVILGYLTGKIPVTIHGRILIDRPDMAPAPAPPASNASLTREKSRASAIGDDASSVSTPLSSPSLSSLELDLTEFFRHENTVLGVPACMGVEVSRLEGNGSATWAADMYSGCVGSAQNCQLAGVRGACF